MSRGSLDEPTLESIAKQIPDLGDLQKTVLGLSPDLISTNYKFNSTIPNAAVCLHDAVHTLAEARYASHEAIAHKIWCLDGQKSRNEVAAVFFARFYADDIALRLYSAGEHLAEAVRDMLEISDQELSPYKEKRVSRQATIGNYLRKERPRHPVTLAVLRLAAAPEWRKTHDYRNEWVHNQPPLVKGLGIVYKRGQRWRVCDCGDSYELGLGGGDEPEYSAEDLLEFIQPALFRFTDLVGSVVQFYVGLLNTHEKVCMDALDKRNEDE